jgi:hypothetical protein
VVAAWAGSVDAGGALVAASTDASLGAGGGEPNPRAAAADAFGRGAGLAHSGRRTRARVGRNASFDAAASTVPVAQLGMAWTVIGQSSSKVVAEVWDQVGDGVYSAGGHQLSEPPAVFDPSLHDQVSFVVSWVDIRAIASSTMRAR